MASRRRYRPTLDECEEAIEFLEDSGNYDLEDAHRPKSLRVRVRDYPEGSNDFFLLLIWFGEQKPSAGEIPVPPNWRLDSDWFLAEISINGVNIKVWQVGLIFEGTRE